MHKIQSFQNCGFYLWKICKSLLWKNDNKEIHISQVLSKVEDIRNLGAAEESSELENITQ